MTEAARTPKYLLLRRPIHLDNRRSVEAAHLRWPLQPAKRDDPRPSYGTSHARRRQLKHAALCAMFGSNKQRGSKSASSDRIGLRSQEETALTTANRARYAEVGLSCRFRRDR